MRDYPEKGIVEFGRGNVVVSCVEYCANKGKLTLQHEYIQLIEDIVRLY